MAVKSEETGKIHVGISYKCKGIGFSKSQKDTQIQNVQKDTILNRGCLKFQAGVFDANNETVAIDIDFLPLWLAKITITPNMQAEQPKVADKLENQMTIDHAKQRTLQNIIAQKVYQRIKANILTGEETNIRACSSRYFKSIYKDLKNRFGVASYRDIKMVDFDNATAYVSAWIEPASVRKEVA